MKGRTIITVLICYLIIVSTYGGQAIAQSQDRTIAGLVADENGVPIQDAKVTLTGTSGAIGSPAFTDAAGAFRFEHVPSMSMYVTALKGDYADRRDIPSAGDQSVSLVLFGYGENGGEPAATPLPFSPATPVPEPEPSVSPEPQPGPTATPRPASSGSGYVISGIVYDGAGSPADNALISLLDTNREPVNTSGNPAHATSGIFRFDLVPTGSYLISAEKDGHSVEIGLDVEGDISDLGLYLSGNPDISNLGPVDLTPPEPIEAEATLDPSHLSDPMATSEPTDIAGDLNLTATASPGPSPLPEDQAVASVSLQPTAKATSSPTPRSMINETGKAIIKPVLQQESGPDISSPLTMLMMACVNRPVASAIFATVVTCMLFKMLNQ